MKFIPTILLICLVLTTIHAEDDDCDSTCILQRCWDYQIPFKQNIMEHTCNSVTLSDGSTVWSMKYTFKEGFTLDTECLFVKYYLGGKNIDSNQKVIYSEEDELTDVYISQQKDYIQININLQQIEKHCKFIEDRVNKQYIYQCQPKIDFHAADLDNQQLQHTYFHRAELKFDSELETFLEVDVVPSQWFDGCCDLDLVIDLVMKQCIAPEKPPTTQDEICQKVHETDQDVIIRGTNPNFQLEITDQTILNLYSLELLGVRVSFGEEGPDQKQIVPNYTAYPIFERNNKLFFGFNMAKVFDTESGMNVEATVRLVRRTERRRLLETLNLRHLNSVLESKVENSDRLVKSNPLKFKIVDEDGNPYIVGKDDDGNNTQSGNNTENDEDDYQQSDVILYSIITGLGVLFLCLIIFAVYKKVGQKGTKKAIKYQESDQNSHQISSSK